DTNPPRETPIREQRLDETEVGRGKFVTFTEITPSKGAAFTSQTNLLLAQFGLDQKDGVIVDHGIYDSIYNPGKFALLIGWKNAQAADRWSPRKIDGVEKLRHRKIRVVRDYGRFDRREAPQYYADVKGRETLHAKRAAPAR
ncbi:MAG: antibiotic biosynthesis monooxygenase, partial [Bradyrhizobium sp.]